MPQNCWEYKKCGREPGGAHANEYGVCPAANDHSCDGINEGKNGGRLCWAIAGTLCDGEVQGIFAEKQLSCISCDFFKKVRKEVRQTQGKGKFQVLKPSQKDLLRDMLSKDILEN
ncbi:MAG: hypothetical protein M1503_01700 [Thaumarchaeota archaeon]|nr:hypothetical protein [Nitrososphaerota archaeon]MCL5316971.1 hypothetical protein [Nitrososphaerota archaeon]